MRAPLLVPGVCGGTAIPDARETRVRAADGALLLQRPGATEEQVLARAGTVTRVVQVAPEALPRRWRRSPHGVWAVMSDAGPAAVLDPREWVAHPDALAGRDLRSVSGLEPLAQAVGTTVEAATPEETVLVRRALPGTLVRPRPDAPGRREDLALCAALVVGFLGMPLSDSWWGTALTTLGLLVAAPAVTALHRRRRAFRQLVTAPLSPDGREVVDSCLGEEWAGLSRSQLQLGHDHVVHRCRGKEAWVAGPGLGGAVRCVAGADDLAFLDAAERVLLRVDARAFDADQVAAACGRAGLAFESTPLYVGHPSVALGSLTLARADSTMSEVEYGSTTIATPALALCASLLLLVGSLLDLRWHAAAAVLALASLALLALTTHSWRLLRGWWVDDRARAVPPGRDGGS